MTVFALFLLPSACDPAHAVEGKRHFDHGSFAEAEAWFRRALDCSTPRLADRINLAATLRERNALAEARHLLRVEISAEPAELQLAYWNCLALIEEQSAHPAQADADYRKALALVTSTTPPRLVLQLWTNLARQHLKQGRLADAETAFNAARQQPGWNHDRPSSYDLNLAELRRMQGRPREAEEMLRSLLALGPALPAQVRGAAANNLASLASLRHAHREAEALWRAAIQAWTDAYGAQHPVVAKGLNNLAAYSVARKRYTAAELLYRQSLAIREDPIVLNNLGTLLHQHGRASEAEALYRRALSLFRSPTRDAIQPHEIWPPCLPKLARSMRRSCSSSGWPSSCPWRCRRMNPPPLDIWSSTNACCASVARPRKRSAWPPSPCAIASALPSARKINAGSRTGAGRLG